MKNLTQVFTSCVCKGYWQENLMGNQMVVRYYNTAM
jgi:hypothetical protein